MLADKGLDILRGCHLLESISAKSANDSYLLTFFADPIDLWAVGPGATAKVLKGGSPPGMTCHRAVFGVMPGSLFVSPHEVGRRGSSWRVLTMLVVGPSTEHFFIWPCGFGVRSALFGGLGPLLESLQSLQRSHDSLVVRHGSAADDSPAWMKIEKPVTHLVRERKNQATEIIVTIVSR
jgi:hypothetical protein